MKKQYVIAALVLFLMAAQQLFAQNTNSLGLGLRLDPDGAGFDMKFLPQHNIALEMQLNGSRGAYRWYGTGIDYGPSVTLVGLVEFNMIIDHNWRLFAGPGMHIGTWDRYYYDPRFDVRTSPQGIFGLDGIFGVEYIFKPVPFALSADIKPAINLAGDLAYFPNNFFGISARYYLHPMAHGKSRAN